MLICSGKMNKFFPKIQRCMKRLKLGGQVKFIGYVSPLEVQCLYRLCRLMVFPSKFEGWGLPITEAFHIGVPAACSNVTSLPDLVGDAAILFDPEKPQNIANAIWSLWNDEKLRLTLIQRGKRRVARYSWNKTSCIFRAHYRRIAGHHLTEEDHTIMSEINRVA